MLFQNIYKIHMSLCVFIEHIFMKGYITEQKCSRIPCLDLFVGLQHSFIFHPNFTHIKPTFHTQWNCFTVLLFFVSLKVTKRLRQNISIHSQLVYILGGHMSPNLYFFGVGFAYRCCCRHLWGKFGLTQRGDEWQGSHKSNDSHRHEQ